MMDYLIIDTREPAEYDQGHADGAINIASGEFMGGGIPKLLRDVAKDRPIILYCRSGQRSNTCAQILQMHGFTNITNGINQHHAARLIKN